MDKVQGKGRLILFRNDTNIVINKDLYIKDYFFSMYNSDLLFNFDDIFIGSDLNLTVTKSFQPEDEVQMSILNPLTWHDEHKFLEGISVSLHLAIYATVDGYLRLFTILVYENNVYYLYEDSAVYTTEKIRHKGTRTHDIRDASFTNSFMYSNKDEYKNDYLWAFSVINEEPRFHIFIISDVIAWIEEVRLPEIVDGGYKVDRQRDSVNYFEGQQSFVIKTYKKNIIGVKSYHFFYYKVANSTSLELFDMYNCTKGTFPLTKIISLRDDMYYLLHDEDSVVDVYTIDKDHQTHYIEYQLNVRNHTQYVTGKTCGRFVVMETAQNSFEVFDIDDILAPMYMMTLPGVEGYHSLLGGSNDAYV